MYNYNVKLKFQYLKNNSERVAMWITTQKFEEGSVEPAYYADEYVDARLKPHVTYRDSSYIIKQIGKIINESNFIIFLTNTCFQSSNWLLLLLLILCCLFIFYKIN
uniref:Uncharacterized protein n=1 Tax=Heterorhabditis bacteriophora TaxID=37862 RepID=A0A1I7WYI4_HETBA